MPIQIKRAYEGAGPDDGYRVLVDRLWPRGISKDEARIDLWLREAAPSTELRRWFHSDRSRWDEFRERYLEELARHEVELATLAAKAQDERVTLVFSAKEEGRNNAVVLKEYLESLQEKLGFRT